VGFQDVADDLFQSRVVVDEVTVDGGHAAGGLWVGEAVVAVVGVLECEHGPGSRGQLVIEGVAGGGADRVSHGSELGVDELIELVAAVGGCGQPEPVPRGDALDGAGVGRGGQVVALIDDDQPVLGGPAGVHAPAQLLEQSNIYDAGGLGPPAAELTGRDAQVLLDPCPPLLGQDLVVDQHQGRQAPGGDQCAGHDGLAGARWCLQDAEVMTAEDGDSGLLLGGEGGRAGEAVRLTDGAGVLGDLQAAAGFPHDGVQAVPQSPGDQQVAVEGFVVQTQEPRGVPRGKPAAFPIVEDRVGLHRPDAWRGAFTSVPELETAIHDWAAYWNTDPRPFIWKATADEIIEKVALPA